jgi:DNA-binding HxlR family transcriptional regulator
VALRSDWSTAECAIARGADVLSDPWTLLLLREVFVGNRRYDGLRARLGAADNILSARLRRMVDDGLLRREPYGAGAKPRHEYHLTPAGADTLPVLNALAVWGEKHTASSTGGAMHVYCARCSTESFSADWCSTCEAPLDAAATQWERPSAPGRRVQLADASTRVGE